MTEPATDVLYHGDNLDILRRYLPDASVDLVYLEPPFNSNRDYNVIFKDESGMDEPGRTGEPTARLNSRPRNVLVVKPNQGPASGSPSSAEASLRAAASPRRGSSL